MKVSPRLLAGVLLPCLAMAASKPANFKVTPGAGVSVSQDANGNYDIVSSLPAHGGNLFETFQDFSLAHGESAKFEAGTGVTSIFARVTSSRSFIDGTLTAPANL